MLIAGIVCLILGIIIWPPRFILSYLQENHNVRFFYPNVPDKSITLTIDDAPFSLDIIYVLRKYNLSS